MATKRSRKAKTRDDRGNGAGILAGANGDVIPPGTTGRYLVLMREGGAKAGLKALRDTAGLRVASTSDFAEGAVEGKQLAEAEAILFEDLGVAVVDTPPEQIQSLSAAAAEENAILAIEPERVVYALPAAVPARAITAEEPSGGAEFFT